MRIIVIAIGQRALEIGKTTASVGQRVLFDGRHSIIVRKAISFFGGAPLRLNCLGRAAAVGGEVAIVALFFQEPEPRRAKWERRECARAEESSQIPNCQSCRKVQKLPGPSTFDSKINRDDPRHFLRQLLNFWPSPNIIQKIAERYKTYMGQMGDTKRKINPRKVPIVSYGLTIGSSKK